MVGEGEWESFAHRGVSFAVEIGHVWGAGGWAGGWEGVGGAVLSPS
jgi:hypothetical protein